MNLINDISSIMNIKFILYTFHRSLLFIIVFLCLFLFLKNKTVNRLLYLFGFFFIGAYIPQLYIDKLENVWYIFFNALLVDIGVIFMFINYIRFIRAKLI